MEMKQSALAITEEKLWSHNTFLYEWKLNSKYTQNWSCGILWLIFRCIIVFFFLVTTVYISHCLDFLWSEELYMSFLQKNVETP